MRSLVWLSATSTRVSLYPDGLDARNELLRSGRVGISQERTDSRTSSAAPFAYRNRKLEIGLGGPPLPEG